MANACALSNDLATESSLQERLHIVLARETFL